ncbi:DUF4175 family protein [Spongiimicrobium sp. 3-5]|uniref:DUF4175 family protein n=1 Tax=Spongiimicrobium sp. 3-5 TaxID=3332596 RepID=UPI0039808479
MLIKGSILFLSLGLLFLLGVLSVEYLLWLNSTWRLVLLLLFLCTELFLLYKYILTPLFYLFKLKRGISNRQASLIIGRYFPEVGDKLYNLLDLAEDTDRSELLLASIAQRSEKLDPIPFRKAISFRENVKYIKYLAIPGIIVCLLWVSGNIGSFFGSYSRVINYNLAYEPPAPFSFNLLSGQLNVLESLPFVIQVSTVGEVKPEDVYLVMNGKEFLLQQQAGLYSYTLAPPLKNTEFYFKANGVTSRSYLLNALETPSIQNFNLVLDYPDYTKRVTEIVKSGGNATFPEGTKVQWEIEGLHTDSIHLVLKDTSLVFKDDDGGFQLSKTIYSSLDYQIATSNRNVQNYETLDYRFEVIKDAYPKINVNAVLDSLNPNLSYYVGQASDDYGLASIRLICYPEGRENDKQIVLLGSPETNFEQFYYTFPSGLKLEENTVYSFYFEVIDNDRIHKGKTVKSKLFSSRVYGSNELKNKELNVQKSLLKDMGKSLERFKEQQETLKEINREQKEKSILNFNEQSQIKDFLQKQQQQERLMKKFSKQLKENLDKDHNSSEENRLLKERLERQELEALKNEKLLEELNKIADKIDKEELSKRLDELGKKQQSSERGLEQLLELTKRYYVTEKAAQLSRDLEELAREQEKLAKEDLGTTEKEEQDKLNERFDKVAEEMKTLKKDNEDLKKPLNLKMNKTLEEGVKEDQQNALEELSKPAENGEGEKESNENTGKKAAPKQKAAAQKIKKMSEELQESMTMDGGGSSITEDAEMLRQILDNLITFSFKQEQLYDSLQDTEVDVAQFTSSVKRQRELQELFKHVDDSLFALSLRRAELSEFVNEQITEVQYNTEKTLESMAERQMYQGVAYQQRVLTAANSLADFLVRLLDNMQQSMSGAGSGNSSEGFQLPDIIKGQGDIKEKMGQMGQSGSTGEQGEKGEPKSGEKGKEGKGEGKEGKDGKPGKGNKGKQGNGKGEGNEGSGKDGQGSGLSEQELQEIYEIYKEQQQIREQLEQQLEDMINAKDKRLAQKLIRQMEDFERDLLENGSTQRTRSKVNAIEYELLKLENATLKQGKKPERESNTNKMDYSNPITTKPSVLDNYRNEVEILNRQALPLRQIFRKKVKDYFKKND